MARSTHAVPNLAAARRLCDAAAAAGMFARMTTQSGGALAVVIDFDETQRAGAEHLAHSFDASRRPMLTTPRLGNRWATAS